VLADVDRDGVFESGELVGATDPATPVRVHADEARDGFLIDGPAIPLDPAHPRTSSVPIRIEVARSHNVLPSLADDFFALRWGRRGLFHPMDLLVHTQGYFFGLEEPDPHKTQVIFVHGAGGVPVEFTSLVESLDRTRYQAWFFFYPSGLPLEQNAAVLSSVLEGAAKDLELRRVAIVAHSMGGLVAHAAVAMLCRDGLPDWLALLVSIATPYGGHDAARLGVQRASEVVPSWRDLVPGGAFLRQLDATPLPDALPFYLVFAYDNGARVRAVPSGDGTITLRSQLALPVHLRARASYGVNATHTSVLTDATTREIVNRLLAEYAAPHG
jgi:triacylglycerol esterase/lipase EstA (alpha/beta hydrolase family)